MHCVRLQQLSLDTSVYHSGRESTNKNPKESNKITATTRAANWVHVISYVHTIYAGSG